MSWWRAQPGLKPGDTAPDFDRLDEDGVRHVLADSRGRWLVLFFYPKDNTPVCVREACAFNEVWEQFQELGADILGCSGQDAESHKAMRAACRLRYRLLCDEDRSAREAWRVPHRLRFSEGRTTYLVDPQGIIRFVFSDLLRGEDHAALTLEFLRQAQRPKV
jgi:peroxiredoxin Q/BCP